MTVKIISENILNPDMFSSATEQDGAYIGQPEADSGNEGNFRLLATGDIQDFSYAGTATGNGSTTTIVDSSLSIFGNDFFIGATITFTDSGDSPVGNISGSETITDFDQATGTLTWSDALISTIIGDTFTLTLSFATRDFKVELINSGDIGNADFKWTHDGGTTYLGRDNPYQADWLALTTIVQNVADSDLNVPRMVEASNGDLVMSYMDTHTYVKISSDKGITWGNPITVQTATDYNCDLIKLKNGRLLALVRITSNQRHEIHYSDDNGATWSELYVEDGDYKLAALLELANGTIVFAYDDSNEIKCKRSYDGGFNFVSEITIAADANSQNAPQLCQAENGDVICVYCSDEDGVAWEIKCAYSTDNCGTWTSGIDVIDSDEGSPADYFEYPDVLKDIDGTLYAIGTDDSNDLIKMAKSTDNVSPGTL